MAADTRPFVCIWPPLAHQDEGWVLRVVRDYDEEKGDIEVRPYKGMGLDGNDTKCMFKYADCHPHDPSHSKNLDDISEIDNLHVAPLLDLLRNWPAFPRDRLSSATRLC